MKMKKKKKTATKKKKKTQRRYSADGTKAATEAVRPVTSSVYPSTYWNGARQPASASPPNRPRLARSTPLPFGDRSVAVS